jgi:hypothetical protein
MSVACAVPRWNIAPVGVSNRGLGQTRAQGRWQRWLLSDNGRLEVRSWGAIAASSATDFFGVLLLTSFLVAFVIPESVRLPVALSFGCLALATALYRSLRIVLIIESDNILIRNFWGTSQVPWADVARIEVAHCGPGMRPACLIFTLKEAQEWRVAYPAHATVLIGSKQKRLQVLEEIKTRAADHGVVTVAAVGHLEYWADPMKVR